MGYASDIERKYYDILLLHSPYFKIKKKWIPGTHINRECSICNSRYGNLGFVDLDYEYEPGLKYPCKEGCNCHMIYAKFVIINS